MPRTLTPDEMAVLEDAVAALGKLPKRKPITIAAAMRILTADMRTAYRFLVVLEQGGLLTRSGGEPGKALLWNRT